MSWSDIQFGEQQGARRAGQEWQNYSSKLESKLGNAERGELHEAVERKVAVAYVKALREALRAVSPNHPMLNDQVAEKLFDEARVKAYAERGFSYDVKAQTFQKRRA